MNGYAFPAWRRVVFVAVLITILVVTFTSSVTQGTVNVRISGFAQGAAITHIYVKFSEVKLHTAGYPTGAGWITLTNLLPVVDLVPQPNQEVPDTIISARIQSGRYDVVSLRAENSTVVVGSAPGTRVSVGSTLSANVTLPVRPSGTGEILLLVLVDYQAILSSSPVLTLKLFQATAA